MKEVETQIANALDTAIRKVGTARQSVANYQATVAFNQDLLRSQLARLEVGKVAATVRQEDVDALFARRIPSAEVRLIGQVGTVLPVTGWKVLPAEQHLLPSAALGWRAGGEVPVSLDDPQGRKAAESFFEVQASLQPAGQVFLLDGRAGKIRFQLDPEPLLPRWIRRLRQMLQKRYQL